MKLEDLFKHGQESAKVIFEKQGSVQPMWICESKDGIVMPIVAPLGDNKDETIEMLKSAFRQHGIVRYVSVIEAWQVTAKTKSEVEVYESLGDHPGRIEVIFVSAEDIGGQSLGGQFIISRPKDGRATLSEFEAFNNDKAEGRFLGLLKTDKSLH